MSDPVPAAESEPSSSKPVSIAAQRIAELNAVSVSISELLSTASAAIRLLTTPDPAVPNRDQAFKNHSAQYHAILSSITVRLRRQILMLEAAEIPLPSDEAGGVDVGALNERNDIVGREMERELWAKARAFLTALESEKAANRGDTMEE